MVQPEEDRMSSIHGFANACTAESAEHLTDPILRQTVCSWWTFVATRDQERQRRVQ